MPTKEEAEAMADAILAAHARPASRAPAGVREPLPGSRLFLVAGVLSGAIAGAMPAHSWLPGALVGFAFAAIAGFIARRV